MVWFQCEDCGENLKKPKLANHFRICSATKLSCIDCGEIFGQQSVQGHTQCITEAEKYGPKGQGKVSNNTPSKSNKDSKQQPDFDIKVGLSSRPPWFCSLCNTKATSEQTLLLHADGKKHRAKARAFHASKQQPQQKEESAQQVKISDDNSAKTETVKNVEGLKVQESSDNIVADAKAGAENGHCTSKKRKLDGSEDGEVGDGEVIQVEGTQQEVMKTKVKKTKKNATEGKLEESSHSSEDALQKMKWKKLVKSNLKSNPGGVMKMKKVKKVLLKAFKESGVTVDEEQFFDMVEKKIKSSSRFNVEGKYVRLAAKD